MILKKLTSPLAEKRDVFTPTPGSAVTPQHRERKERDQENKENIAEEKGVDVFALPHPRTPASSKKNRPNKNVLNTPNQNTNCNGTKASVATPKGKWRFIVCKPAKVIEYRQYRT